MMMLGFAIVIVAVFGLVGCVSTPVESENCLYRQQGEKPAGAGGQDVNVAVGQPRAAAGRMAR